MEDGMIKIDGKSNRMYFIDNLKVFLTILVIIHHVGQPYGPTGGFWQYKSSLNENITWLGSFFAVNASFFMGLFFMISGYFIPRSYDRKGCSAFLKDKLLRFGIPLIFGFLIMQPLQMYFYYNFYSGNIPIDFIEYYQRIYLGIGGKPHWFKAIIGWPEFNFGHLWFIEHLLIYAIIYCFFRIIFSKRKVFEYYGKNMHLSISMIALLIAFISAIVRTQYPIDRWIGILGFIQSEVAHLPQYVGFFMLGIIAYRRKWFIEFDKSIGYVFLTTGFLMATIIYISFIIPGNTKKILFSNWAFYETFMAMALCWGLIVLFREKLNGTSPMIKFLAENAYAAYIVHVPVVLMVQYLLDKMNLYGAIGKFAAVSILSIALTFTISYLIKRIPYVKRVI